MPQDIDCLSLKFLKDTISPERKRGEIVEKVKVVIIGSGPAGYTAALYVSRARLNPVLFEGFMSGPVGGQLMTTDVVENYPGFPDGIEGPEMMEKFREQAKRFGTQVFSEDVVSVDLSKRPFTVSSKKNSFLTDSIIIATGAYAKRLDIPGTLDGQFWQKGVTACAICDGAIPIFRDKELYVVGGGDSACEEALFLTKYGSKIYIVHRRNELRASKIMSSRVEKHPKIEILWDSVLTNVEGDQIVRSVTLKNVSSGKEEKRVAGGVFFAVGHVPNTSFLNGQIALHENGYIKVQPGTTQTTVEGVFAAGDCQDHVYRQAVTAAGSGCMAAIEAERWLAEHE